DARQLRVHEAIALAPPERFQRPKGRAEVIGVVPFALLAGLDQPYLGGRVEVAVVLDHHEAGTELKRLPYPVVVAVDVDRDDVAQAAMASAATLVSRSAEPSGVRVGVGTGSESAPSVRMWSWTSSPIAPTAAQNWTSGIFSCSLAPRGCRSACICAANCE